MNSFKVLKKPVDLSYAHSRAYNRTALGGRVELDLSNTVSGKYDFGSGHSKIKYRYSHNGLTTVEPGYNFDRKGWQLAASHKFSGGDVVKASYKSDRKILGVDFVKNTGDGNFKVCATNFLPMFILCCIVWMTSLYYLSGVEYGELYVCVLVYFVLGYVC